MSRPISFGQVATFAKVSNSDRNQSFVEPPSQKSDGGNRFSLNPDIIKRVTDDETIEEDSREIMESQGSSIEPNQ